MNTTYRTTSGTELPLGVVSSSPIHTLSGYHVEKVITGYGYARNGNNHNPTPHVRWDVRHNGRLIGSAGKRSHVVEIAHMDAES